MLVLWIYAFSQSNTKNNKDTAAASDAPVVILLVDHHKHLSSPSTAEYDRNPFLPAIQVPKDLARLLREWTLRFDNRETTADLYTEKAIKKLWKTLKL